MTLSLVRVQLVSFTHYLKGGEVMEIGLLVFISIMVVGLHVQFFISGQALDKIIATINKEDKE